MSGKNNGPADGLSWLQVTKFKELLLGGASLFTPAELGETLTKLLQSSLSKSSLSTYQCPWKLFNEFTSESLGKKPELPLSAQMLALFIAYLARKGYASSTAIKFVSAIGYGHRILSFPDPTRSDVIKLALKA